MGTFCKESMQQPPGAMNWTNGGDMQHAMWKCWTKQIYVLGIFKTSYDATGTGELNATFEYITFSKAEHALNK